MKRKWGGTVRTNSWTASRVRLNSRPVSMKSLFSIVFACSGVAAAFGASTALEAVRLLPKGEARNLARIEAREGTPEPERWYLLTHDEKAENGLHEYVVAGGELVASRTLSQFAETVQPEEVVGGEAVKFDSDSAAKLAQHYAAANQLAVAAFHYELRKDGPDAVPLWTVTCVDSDGQELARLVVSASKGNVISRDGFAVEPPPLPVPAPTPAPAPRQVVKSTPVPKPKPKTAGAETKPEPKPEPEIRRPTEVRPPREVAEKPPGFFQRVSGSIQKVITGKSPEER